MSQKTISFKEIAGEFVGNHKAWFFISFVSIVFSAPFIIPGQGFMWQAVFVFVSYNIILAANWDGRP